MTAVIIFALSIITIFATWAGFASMRGNPAPPPEQRMWLTEYYDRYDRPRTPRFSLRVDGELLEADGFGGIIEQMRARGYSTDDLVAAALVVHHTPVGAEIKLLVDVARGQVTAALHDLRCQDAGCVSQGEGEAIMCERCPRVGCSDCIAFDEGRRMYICDLCPEDA